MFDWINRYSAAVADTTSGNVRSLWCEDGYIIAYDPSWIFSDLYSSYPKDKQIKIMGWYSIAETDEPEDINSICSLQEVDIDTLEVTGEITDFVAIVSDKYHGIASEFP